MHLIKFDAIDSTSAFLRKMMEETDVPDRTVVWALDQRNGKGQPGRSWETEKGKNLTFSMLCKFKSFRAKDHFILNILISTAIYRVLNAYGIPGLRIKWPNDIMSGKHKICGILIENQLAGQQLKKSIIGIGLNVNQVEFKNLPIAASLYQLTGKYFELEPLLTNLVSEIAACLPSIVDSVTSELRSSYVNLLYGLNERLQFRDCEKDELFEGAIRGIDESGMLLVEQSCGLQQAYTFRTIQLISRS